MRPEPKPSKTRPLERYNPYHQLTGEHGGEFISKPGGGLKLDLPKPPELTLKERPIGVGTTINKSVYKRVNDAAQQHGFKSAKQAVDELAAEMESMLSDNNMARARDWYRQENVRAHRRAQKHGVSLETAVATEAATSPRCQYETNQKITEIILENKDKDPQEVMNAIGGLTMNDFKLSGLKFANGADPKTLGGTKVRSFYNNIMFPGQTNDVTIDTLMTRVLQKVASQHARGAKKPITSAPVGKQKNLGIEKALKWVNGSGGGVVGSGYFLLADAVRKVAANHKESPDTIQSAVWLAVRGRER